MWKIWHIPTNVIQYKTCNIMVLFEHMYISWLFPYAKNHVSQWWVKRILILDYLYIFGLLQGQRPCHASSTLKNRIKYIVSSVNRSNYWQCSRMPEHRLDILRATKEWMFTKMAQHLRIIFSTKMCHERNPLCTLHSAHWEPQKCEGER